MEVATDWASCDVLEASLLLIQHSEKPANNGNWQLNSFPFSTGCYLTHIPVCVKKKVNELPLQLNATPGVIYLMNYGGVAPFFLSLRYRNSV